MQKFKGYSLIEEYELKDINSKGYLLRHDKTGARVAVVLNDDNNKVFSIGFKTPPKDSTGVAHIIEHTVLCGSRKFKAKDPFIELAKGSLNTFLNAMTYPDKTVYPVASCNDKDFKNLMDVYLDSVFYPNIYNEEKIFMQEGWHYEMDSIDADITYNGVVYNEMKGAFSSPDQVLYRTISTALFPDTTYAVESGGDPDFIPDLTYEQFLDFHRKYYHPSNSYIYLYGNIDVAERLEWMDREYLSAFGNDKVDSEITIQEPFESIAYYEKSYPVGSQDEDEDKTYLAYASSFGLSTDNELSIAFSVLCYLLVEAPGAKLKQRLLDEGIGRDIMCDFENEIRQPIFSIVAKDAKASQKDRFLSLIREELAKQVMEGFDANAITAALAKMEFKYREADFESFPKGLIYGLDMFSSWLYDDNAPFDSLQLNAVYESLRAKIGTGYYESLVEKYLLKNTHEILLVVSPDKSLGAKKEQELKDKLKKYKESLSEQELKAIIAKTKELKEYQEKGSTKEELATIPQLKREDISRKALPISNIKLPQTKTDIIWHDIFTNEIAYADIYLDLGNVPLELTQYLGLYSTALGYFNTNKHTYLELANLMNMYTGGIGFVSSILSKNNEIDNIEYKFKISTRFLYSYTDKAFELINEIIHDTLFEDEKHLHEIIREARSRMNTRLNSSSHTIAVRRADSYYYQAGMFVELTSGIEYYNFLVDCDDNFEERKDTIIEIFNALTKLIFVKHNSISSLTCDSKGKDMVAKKIDELVDGFGDNCDVDVKTLINKIDAPFVDNDKFVLEQKNEGFKFAGQVQYVCRTGSFVDEEKLKYTGALGVLKTILGYGYLWEKVRVTGGAYGCMVSFSKIGISSFVSYRDPNLAKTNDVFESIVDYLESFDIDEDEMTKYVIGTIGRMDTPMNPHAKGNRDFSLYYDNSTYEDIEKIRHETIDVTVEDIKALSKYIKNILGMGNICVIGNESKIEENKELFKEVKSLC